MQEMEEKSHSDLMFEIYSLLVDHFNFPAELDQAYFDDLDEDKYFLYVQKKLQTMGLSFSLKQVKGLLSVWETNRKARYYPENQISGENIVLVKGRDSRAYGVDLFEQLLRTNDYGWNQFTTTQITPVVCPGDHFSILEEPHVRDLTHLINGIGNDEEVSDRKETVPAEPA